MNSKFYISPSLSNFLNTLRWVSAFLVVAGHLRSILFVDVQDVESMSLIWKFFYFVTGFRHLAVMVFFVISGFLVSGSMIKRFKQKNLSFRKYIIFDRGIRIYLVLIPALFLTLLLDKVALLFFNKEGLYTNVMTFSSLNYDISSRLNIDNFFGNLFMLQETFFVTFGSNSPLWSLAYEFWYYLIFFTILSIFNKKIHIRIITFILLLLILFILNKNIILYFSIWLLGIIPWYINKVNKKLFLLFILVFLASSVVSRLHLFENPFIIDFIFGASITGLIIILKHYDIYSSSFLTKMNTALSSFSYTLYLTHFSFLLFIISLINTLYEFKIQNQPNITRFSIYILLIVIIYLFAYFFAHITEFKTKQIQKRLQK